MHIEYRIAAESEKHVAISLIEHVFKHELGYTGIGSDEFDNTAIFFLGYVHNGEGTNPVAALRLVPDNPHGLPLDRYFDLSPLRSQSDRLVEVSRLACLKSHRQHLIGIRGVRFLKATTERLGFTHLVIDSLLRLVPLYERIGFTKFGAPFFDDSVYKPGETHGIPNAQVMFAERTRLIEAS